MITQISKIIRAMSIKHSRRENFSEEDKDITQGVVELLVAVFLVLVLIVVGKFLWNEVLTKLVSTVKPMKHAYEVLGLYVLLRLLFPYC